jgi:hypothetical protein
MQAFQLPPLDRILDLARQRPDFPKVHVSEYLRQSTLPISNTEPGKFISSGSSSSDSVEYNTLNSDVGSIKVGHWSLQEDTLLKQLVMKHGRKWKLISKDVPGRNVSQCKKRYQRMKEAAAINFVKRQSLQLLP